MGSAEITFFLTEGLAGIVCDPLAPCRTTPWAVMLTRRHWSIFSPGFSVWPFMTTCLRAGPMTIICTAGATAGLDSARAPAGLATPSLAVAGKPKPAGGVVGSRRALCDHPTPGHNRHSSIGVVFLSSDMGGSLTGWTAYSRETPTHARCFQDKRSHSAQRWTRTISDGSAPKC